MYVWPVALINIPRLWPLLYLSPCRSSPSLLSSLVDDTANLALDVTANNILGITLDDTTTEYSRLAPAHGRRRRSSTRPKAVAEPGYDGGDCRGGIASEPPASRGGLVHHISAGRGDVYIDFAAIKAPDALGHPISLLDKARRRCLIVAGLPRRHSDHRWLLRTRMRTPRAALTRRSTSEQGVTSFALPEPPFGMTQMVERRCSSWTPAGHVSPDPSDPTSRAAVSPLLPSRVHRVTGRDSPSSAVVPPDLVSGEPGSRCGSHADPPGPR